jgi:hypothetical protein
LIPFRGWAALAILALLCFAASKSHADPMPRHQRPGPTTCEVVRQFVAMVGPQQAEKLARESGQSDARIAAARKCLQDVK